MFNAIIKDLVFKCKKKTGYNNFRNQNIIKGGNNMAKFISRRDFLKGTAAGALGLAATSLLGGASVQAKAEGPGGAAEVTQQSEQKKK